jgi:dipeptidyl aminopeptidase/acylaminoacyl peptidase
MAMQDIVDAVNRIQQVRPILRNRIYLLGTSGGGHMALMMAAKYPEIWAAVSVWVPLYSLSEWYAQQVAWANPAWDYDEQVATICGGAPGSSTAADAEYAARSPSTWLRQRYLPVHINTGIDDGNGTTAAVQPSQAVKAFNALAYMQDRVTSSEMAIIDAHSVPEGREFAGSDATYGAKTVLMRVTSGPATLTIFDGGHECVFSAVYPWLAGKYKPRPTLMSIR